MNNGIKGRILVVEDDPDIAQMLEIFFSGHGYHVDTAARGGDALDRCRRAAPDLIVLDIMLPDMDGYQVCQTLRTTTRTSHVPIIFLTQKDERSDRIAGLELGADDYITKPFDIDELRLRVANAIRAHQRLNMTDPRTGLPGGRLIEDQLRKLMRTPSWSLLQVGIDNFAPFTEAYGFVAADEVLRHAGMLINELVDAHGTSDDFIGHSSGDSFIIVTLAEDVAPLVEALRGRFAAEIRTHYNFMDSEQGGIMVSGRLASLMSLSIGLVTSETQPFADIREITEAAAEMRQLDQAQQLASHRSR
jgi:diguanylate cyclase (GGDEF)-like protein